MLPVPSSALRFLFASSLWCATSPDTADISENEILWTFCLNFLVKYPSEARHKVLELQNVGMQQDEEGEVQRLRWSLLVNEILESGPNSFVTCNVPVHIELHAPQGLHLEGRAGGSKYSYGVHTPPPLLRNTNNVED